MMCLKPGAGLLCGKRLVIGTLLWVSLHGSLWAQSYRAAASSTAPSGTLSLTINKPTGATNGDLMIAAIAVRPETATITAPSGWTLIRRTNNSNSTQSCQATYYKAAGASEPASYTWSFNTSTGSAGGIMAFYGVNASSPVDVENGQTTAYGLIHAAPSVTTTFNYAMIVTSHSFPSGATWSPPSGMTEVVDRSSDAVPSVTGIAIEMNYVLQASAGATGTKTATASNDDDYGVAQTLALVPTYTKTWDRGAATNNWGDANNWNPNGVPNTYDVVSLTGADTIDINLAATARNLILNNSSLTLTTLSTRSLTVSNDLSMTAGTFNTQASFPTISGTVSLDGGTVGYTAGSGTQTVAAQTYYNLTLSGGGTKTMPASTMTVAGDFTMSGTPSATAAGALTVDGDFSIGSGCTFGSGSYTHYLSGNFANSGTFTASTSEMYFTGAASKTISGASTTTFNYLTVDKGSGSDVVLEATSVIGMAAGGLTLTNGTLKISSNSTLTPFTADITTAPYLIPSTAGLWVNGGAVSTTSDVSAAGLIRVSSGTLNVGNAANHRFMSVWATVIIEGGAFNVAGRFTYQVAGLA